MDAKLLFVHALSPLHAGTGQGVGVIDLPIAREKATNLPYLPGSSLKGVLRDNCQDESVRHNVFGPDTNRADEHAGSVHLTDQRLLFFPVRSLTGTFAWVTSPLVLRRFLRDAAMAQNNPFAGLIAPSDIPDGKCRTSNAPEIIGSDDKITLEDLQLAPLEEQLSDEWSTQLGSALFPNDTIWQSVLKARLCLVSDDTFGFLIETATEIVARIALEKDTKTVQQGALWYEESLPAESILSGLVVASPVKADSDTVFNTVSAIIATPLQLGGNATVGRGLCVLHILS